MDVVVVLLLALLWASILIPGLFRNRPHRSPQTSIDAFERSMDVLAHRRDAPAPVEGGHVRTAAPRHSPGVRARTLRRRRVIAQTLVVLTVLSGLALAVAGPVALPLLGLSATVCLVYLASLAWLRTRERAVARTLRPLPQRAHEARGERAGGVVNRTA